MLTTTFARLRRAGACTDRYRHLAKALGGVTAWGKDTPIPLLTILSHNGLQDALWALVAVPEPEIPLRDWMVRQFACDCAERVLPILEREYPGDVRPREAIAVAPRYAVGASSEAERAAAESAAWTALGRLAAVAAALAAESAAVAAAGAAELSWQAGRFRELLSAPDIERALGGKPC